MGLSSELSCEAGSFSYHINLHSFFSVRGFEALFPHIGTWLVQSVSLLSCSSQFICTKCGAAHSASHCLACPGLPALALLQVLSTWLPVSAPPASLDECFFFNSSVVGLLYSLIFWQFWLFFKFKFVVFLLLVVRGGKAYLPMPPSWLEILIYFLIILWKP